MEIPHRKRKSRSKPKLSGVLLIGLLMSACGTKTPEPSVADQLKKVWTAQTVKENNVIVYTGPLATNVRNYTGYKLDLSHPPSVSFTDWDGLLCTGQYEVTNDTRLLLTNLTPQPTGTNGRIEFTINSVRDNQLDLTRTTISPKTGGTSNQYVLTSL